jgi:hypothetical protein
LHGRHGCFNHSRTMRSVTTLPENKRSASIHFYPTNVVDKKSWVADAVAFAATCQRFQVPAVVERSRSGNGAHLALNAGSALVPFPSSLDE